MSRNQRNPRNQHAANQRQAGRERQQQAGQQGPDAEVVALRARVAELEAQQTSYSLAFFIDWQNKIAPIFMNSRSRKRVIKTHLGEKYHRNIAELHARAQVLPQVGPINQDILMAQPREFRVDRQAAPGPPLNRENAHQLAQEMLMRDLQDVDDMVQNYLEQIAEERANFSNQAGEIAQHMIRNQNAAEYANYVAEDVDYLEFLDYVLPPY